MILNHNDKRGFKMSELQNYKCPACGGMLQFSSREQKLVCANCKSAYDVGEFEAAGGLGEAGDYQAQTDTWNVQADGLVPDLFEPPDIPQGILVTHKQDRKGKRAGSADRNAAHLDRRADGDRRCRRRRKRCRVARAVRVACRRRPVRETVHG